MQAQMSKDIGTMNANFNFAIRAHGT